MSGTQVKGSSNFWQFATRYIDEQEKLNRTILNKMLVVMLLISNNYIHCVHFTLLLHIQVFFYVITLSLLEMYLKGTWIASCTL